MSIYTTAYKKNINWRIKRNIDWFSFNTSRFCDGLRYFFCVSATRLVANRNFHNRHLTILC